MQLILQFFVTEHIATLKWGFTPLEGKKGKVLSIEEVLTVLYSPYPS